MVYATLLTLNNLSTQQRLGCRTPEHVVYVGGEAPGSTRWHRARHVEVLPLPLVLARFVKTVENPWAKGDVDPHSSEQLNRDRVTSLLQSKS